MECYYGVTRSPEYLAHYGVRGMKWGVRKAIAKGNNKRLSDHYQKALLKQYKLMQKTSRKGQREDAKSSLKGGALLLGTAAAGGLASRKIPKLSNELLGYSAISAAGGLAALGSAGASAYRTTKFGHKRAVAKYNRFNNEMKKTFTPQMRKKINQFIKANPEYDWFDGSRYRRR